MLNLKDQAEGLRNLLGNKKNKSYIVLSALSKNDKYSTLLNLAIAITDSGESAQIIDANRNADEASTDSNLILERNINKILVTNIFSSVKDLHGSSIQTNDILHLIEESINKSVISFIDIDIDEEVIEHLDVLTNGEVIVLVENQENSIKQAYTLLKKLSLKIADLKVNILVDGNNKKESQLIQRNISLTASKNLFITTKSLGNVIKDQELIEANKIGKSIFDIFPESKSADIFRQIAKTILKEPTVTNKSNPSTTESYHSMGVQ